MLTAANQTTKKAQEVLVADAGQLLVENVEKYPAHEQYEPNLDLGSEEVAASKTEYLPAYASIPTLSMRTLFVTITGDGTASIGIDIAVALDASSNPIWFRWEAALGTGLTKVSGDGGKVILQWPAGLWARYLRVWVAETGTSNTVTVAATVGGRP